MIRIKIVLLYKSYAHHLFEKTMTVNGNECAHYLTETGSSSTSTSTVNKYAKFGAACLWQKTRVVYNSTQKQYSTIIITFLVPLSHKAETILTCALILQLFVLRGHYLDRCAQRILLAL